MAVLSNKPGDLCRIISNHFNIDQYLIAVFGGGDSPNLKPEPDGMNKIIKAAELNGFRNTGDNIWMVGDHHTDLQLAENAAVKSIYCNYGFGFKKNINPGFEADTFNEIVSIISG